MGSEYIPSMKRSVSLFSFTSLAVGVMALMVFLSPFSVSQNLVKGINGTPAGWSNDINLSNHTVQDTNPAIALNDDTLGLVWISNYVDLLFYKSNDDGNFWGALSTIGHSNELMLNADIDISGQNVHAVWDDREGWNGVYYRNSTDNGESWSPTKRISPDGVNAGNPHIFVNNSNVHIAWHDFRVGTNGQIFYRRSLDGGTTFENGQGVDEDRQLTFSPADIGAVSMAGDGSNISVIWYDERSGSFDLYWMISKDNGFTWENGLGNVGQDRRLTTTGDFQHAIAVNGSNIYIVYTNENWPGPTYNIYYLNSSDNGITWNSPVLLSGPNSASFAPNIAVYENNIWVTWNDNRDGSHEIFFKNTTDGGITWGNDTRLTEVDGFTSGGPKVALNESIVHVIWTDQGDGNREIYYKRYPDFPDTTPPSHSNEIPLPDSFKDAPGTNISVHVTDPSGVNATTIQLWVNGSLVSHTLTPITDGYNVSWASGGFNPGVVTCRIIAEDNCSNQLDYTWNFTVLALYEIPLQEGWNLISLPLGQVDTSIPTVLASIDGQYDVVKYYNCIDTADHWKTYRPGGSVNDLMDIDNTMGFWIKITEPYVILTVKGIIPTSTIIPLYAGWNLVGYPTQTTETVGNALWGTGADRVEVFDPVSPYIKEVGATYIMKPGEGYWIHVSADTVWTINW